jgi:TonB family protein
MIRIYVLIILLASFSLQAQDDANNSATQSDGDPDAVPLRIDDLVSHGFSFDDQKWPMCEVTGSEGACHVEAFVFGEKAPSDETAHTCTKLDKARYVGHCVRGRLEGLSIVIADGSTKEAYVSYFLDGRIAYPALTSSFSGNLNFGVLEKSISYGCVYFGRWDASAKRCGRFTAIYSDDIFTESNAQELRDGTFDLSHYRVKFLDFMQQPSASALQTSSAATSPDPPKLEVLTRVPAVYPAQAKAEYLQGRVMIKFHLSETGDVENAEVFGEPIWGRTAILDEAALEAAKQWKFKPYIRDGRPVKVTTILPFDFKLGDQIPDWGSEEPPERHDNATVKGVIQGRLIHQVPPMYPPEGKLQQLTGSVVLHAQIGKDGNVRFLHVVQGNPLLAKAAMDAVKQWKYTPYILNGEPTDVNTDITVNFTPN